MKLKLMKIIFEDENGEKLVEDLEFLNLNKVFYSVSRPCIKTNHNFGRPTEIRYTGENSCTLTACTKMD